MFLTSVIYSLFNTHFSVILNLRKYKIDYDSPYFFYEFCYTKRFYRLFSPVHGRYSIYLLAYFPLRSIQFYCDFLTHSGNISTYKGCEWS